jgi:hypothetical protein
VAKVNRNWQKLLLLDQNRPQKRSRNTNRGSVAMTWVCDGNGRTGCCNTNNSRVERGLDQGGPLSKD